MTNSKVSVRSFALQMLIFKAVGLQIRRNARKGEHPDGRGLAECIHNVFL